MFGLGAPEITILALLAVLFFGAGALPKLAKSIGQSKKEFEKGFKEGEDSVSEPEVKEEDK